MDQLEKAQELRRLHEAPELLVLVNVWDAASARAVAAAPGCRALATASWSVAAALGMPDGEAIGRERMVEAVRVIAEAVDVPVTADLEAGYGDSAETVAGALAAGAVGCNLEDAMKPTEEHAAQVSAARAAGEAAGIPLVINARTDVFLSGGGDVGEALERGRAYAEAGGDVIFVPGVTDAATIERLVAEMGAPVSLIATPESPPLPELERMGVARVSLGPGSLGIAMAALRDAAETMLGGGELPPELAYRMT
jgi:2-methylisocitrate lyase-like PEP mutase family enzyme